MWTGDTFYVGAIWLFAEETNLEAYKHSIKRLSLPTDSINYLLPAHNTPLPAPSLLKKLDVVLKQIEEGKVKGIDSTEGRVNYTFEDFTILMRKP